jgi:H+-transporting ATPase
VWSPLSWPIWAAALVAIALTNGERRLPLQGFATAVVAFLLLISFIAFYKNSGAGNGVRALVHTPAPKAKVKRDGSWVEIESAMLVPGDMITFKVGDIIPADFYPTKAINVSIDQAVLTGDSFPVSKNEGDACLS